MLCPWPAIINQKSTNDQAIAWQKKMQTCKSGILPRILSHNEANHLSSTPRVVSSVPIEYIE